MKVSKPKSDVQNKLVVYFSEFMNPNKKKFVEGGKSLHGKTELKSIKVLTIQSRLKMTIQLFTIKPFV